MLFHVALFNLILILLPTQLGLHFWPDWAFVLGRRVDYLSPTLYLTDICIIGLLIAWGFANRKIFFRKRRVSHAGIFQAFIVVGFIFLNVYFAANRWAALFAWIKVAELAGLAFYIIRTKPKFSFVIFPLSIGVLYSSIIAIMQFIFQHSLGGIFWFLGERTFTSMTPGIAQIPFCFPGSLNCPLLLRAYATFPHPNVLGGFLAITMPLILVQLFKKRNLFLPLTFILGILALVFTFSRSAWVVGSLSIVYVLFKKKKHAFFFGAVFLCICFALIARTVGLGDESVVVRQQLNAAAASMFYASPIIGNGLGNFLVVLPDHLISRQIYFLQPAHNIYLLLLSQTGIIGFVLLLWILWKALSCHSLCFYRLSLGMILLLGLVDHYFLTLQQGQLLLTIFIALSLIRKKSLNP